MSGPEITLLLPEIVLVTMALVLVMAARRLTSARPAALDFVASVITVDADVGLRLWCSLEIRRDGNLYAQKSDDEESEPDLEQAALARQLSVILVDGLQKLRQHLASCSHACASAHRLVELARVRPEIERAGPDRRQ